MCVCVRVSECRRGLLDPPPNDAIFLENTLSQFIHTVGKETQTRGRGILETHTHTHTHTNARAHAHAHAREELGKDVSA